MLKKILIPILFVCINLVAQTKPNVFNINSSICGKVSDKSTKESIPFANIILIRLDSASKFNANSDLNGDFCFTNLRKGKYKVEVVYVGYTKQTVTNIAVIDNKKTELKIAMNTSEGVKLDEVTVKNSVPAIKKIKGKGNFSIYKESYVGSVSTNNVITAQDFNTEEYSKINDNEFKEAKKIHYQQ